MIKLTIDKKKYIIPDRLTVQQWKDMISFDFTDYLQYAKIIASLTGADAAAVAKCTEDSQILAVGFIINLMNQRKEYKVRDFNAMLFGEFVDLDIYVVMGVEKNLDTILEILTPEGKEVTEWADEAMWLIDRYTQFRVFTYRQYSGLFGLNQNGEQEQDEDDLEAYDPKKIAKGWYKVIIDLADNDLQKIDYVTEQPLKKVLNFMAHRKEKQLEENFKLMQQKRQYDVQRNRK
jgi:hypothetical protein